MTAALVTTRPDPYYSPASAVQRLSSWSPREDLKFHRLTYSSTLPPCTLLQSPLGVSSSLGEKTHCLPPHLSDSVKVAAATLAS